MQKKKESIQEEGNSVFGMITFIVFEYTSVFNCTADTFLGGVDGGQGRNYSKTSGGSQSCSGVEEK